MSLYDFYSDRLNGPTPRTDDEVQEPTARGLYALVMGKANTGWLAQKFPDKCPDGQGIVGTDFGGILGSSQSLHTAPTREPNRHRGSR